MRFAYTAKSATGAVTTGVLAAESSTQAHQLLREQGLFALSVIASRERARRRRQWTMRRGKKVSTRDLVGLTAQLSIMAKSGVDLAGALETLARQCDNPTLRRTLEQIHSDVAGGKSVSAALRAHQHIFGQAYVASVAAGEASGQLPAVLGRLAAMLRGELRLKSQVRTLMAYPIVLSCVSFLVLCGLVLFVLPQFEGIFDQFEVPLPAITQFLLDLSAELRSRWWIWVPSAMATLVGLWLFKRSTTGRRLWDSLVLNTIVVRDVTRAMFIGRAFRLLGIMIESGVPLLEGLRLTRASMRNVHYKRLFDALEQDILNGGGLGEALTEASFVPPAAAQMVLTGQRTGTLGMVTRTMGEFYEEEGEAKLGELAKILEPAIIVVMGVIVATVVLSVMLPMFDFATFASKH